MKFSRVALIHFLFIAASVIGFASISIADTVTLTDGTVFKGDILTDTKTEVTMNCKVGGKYEVKKFARAKIKSVVDDAPKVSGGGEPKTPPTSTGATSGGSASGGTASKKPPSGAGTDPAPSESSDAAKADDEAKAAEAAVDGDSLYARIKTMRDSKSSAAEILQAVFEGFPANVLKYEVAEGPTQVKLTDQAAAEGDVIVQVKVDFEIDKEKYAIWCKGAKEAFSAIATEKKTISWNPKKGGAVKISKKPAPLGKNGEINRNVSYDGKEFVDCFSMYMSEKTAKAEHLWIESSSWKQFTQQIDVMSKSVSDSKGSKANKSLRDGIEIKKDLYFVCLLSSAGGSLDVFGIPTEVMKNIDIFSQAPLISTDLLDEAGETIASIVRPKDDPVIFVKGASRAKARLGKNGAWWNASPALKSQTWCLITPFLNGEADRDQIFSSRISIPFWFSIALKDLPNCKKVDVQLGDKTAHIDASPDANTGGTTPAKPQPMPTPAETASPLSWAEVLEQNPDPKVVTDADFLKRITETKLPWRVKDKASGMEMLLVPPGKFVMGASPGDSLAEGNEKPAHEVTITKAFYLGRTEVRQEQWIKVMTENPSSFKTSNESLEIKVAKYIDEGLTKQEAQKKAGAESPNKLLTASNPVEQVSWDDCQKFCAKTGMKLPTEAQWEYACRAGVRKPSYGELDQIAWYGNNSDSTTHPVAKKARNALGFNDMIGNVAEWTNDWYEGDYYKSCADGVVDPTGPAQSELGLRVLRGGGWSFFAGNCRASCRNNNAPDFQYNFIGCRFARTAD